VIFITVSYPTVWLKMVYRKQENNNQHPKGVVVEGEKRPICRETISTDSCFVTKLSKTISNPNKNK
jgi:hypothetical protein